MSICIYALQCLSLCMCGCVLLCLEYMSIALYQCISISISISLGLSHIGLVNDTNLGYVIVFSTKQNGSPCWLSMSWCISFLEKDFAQNNMTNNFLKTFTCRLKYKPHTILTVWNLQVDRWTVIGVEDNTNPDCDPLRGKSKFPTEMSSTRTCHQSNSLVNQMSFILKQIETETIHSLPWPTSAGKWELKAVPILNFPTPNCWLSLTCRRALSEVRAGPEHLCIKISKIILFPEGQGLGRGQPYRRVDRILLPRRVVDGPHGGHGRWYQLTKAEALDLDGSRDNHNVVLSQQR